MNTDIFAEMLMGKDLAEAYIESDEGKKEININSSLMAVIHVLLNNNLVTGEKFEKYRSEYEEVLKNKIRAEFKKLQEE